jgi:SAM-dependent methyltransferase
MSIGGLLDGYDVVVCDNCGFCYADNIPQQSDFDIYYRDMSKYEHPDRDNQTSSFDIARFRSTLSALIKFIPRSESRILEIGCSTGELLSLLKDNGFENVAGIDPSPACAETARRLYGIRVISSSLFVPVVDESSIDVVVMVGVLEHVRELKTALKLSRDMLKEDGLVYIEVPDASHYVKGEDAPFQEFSLEHINFFGPVSLRNLLISNGFAQVHLERSMVEANYRTSTPAIRAIFRKDNTGMPSAIKPDLQTKVGLRLYVDKSNQEDKQIRDAIANIVTVGRSIIVWGTGAHTLRLLATSKLGEAKIIAFVDSNPKYQGKKLNGLPIVAPQAIKDWSDPILISSRVYQEEIAGQIMNELHLENEIIRLYDFGRGSIPNKENC